MNADRINELADAALAIAISGHAEIAALRDAALASAAVPVAAQEPAQAPDLHAAIMNLPCNPPFALSADATLAYKIGHRDARHAAAAIAASGAAPWEGRRP